MDANILAIFLFIHSAACSDGYYWKNYEPAFTQNIPSDAVVAGMDTNQENLFIGQMNIWGYAGIHPTTISAGQKVWTPYQGSQIFPTPTTFNQNNYGGNQNWQYNQPNPYNGQASAPQGGAEIATFVLGTIKQSMNPYLPKAAQWIPQLGPPNVNQGTYYTGQTNYGNYGGNSFNTNSPVQQVPSNNGPQNAITFIQILCSKDKSKFKWLPASSRTLHQLRTTNEVVRGGLDQNNFLTYIGRVKHQGNVVIGKVSSNNANNMDMVFVFNNQEYRVNSFEILTYSN